MNSVNKYLRLILSAVISVTAFALNSQTPLNINDLNIDLPADYQTDTSFFFSFKGKLYFLAKNPANSSIKIGICNNTHVWYTPPVFTNSLNNFYDMDVNPNGIFLSCRLDSVNGIGADPGNQFCLLAFSENKWNAMLQLGASSYTFNKMRLRYFKEDLYMTLDTVVFRQSFSGSKTLYREGRIAPNSSLHPMIANNKRLLINGDFFLTQRPVIIAPAGSTAKYNDTLRLNHGIFHIAQQRDDLFLKLGSDGLGHYTLETLDSTLTVISTNNIFNDSLYSFSDSGYLRSRVFLFKNQPVVASYQPNAQQLIYWDNTTDKWLKLAINGRLIRSVGSEGKIYGYNRLTGGFSEINYATYIEGYAFVEREINCQRDSSLEPPLKNKLITFYNAYDTSLVFTDTNGYYRIYLPHSAYYYSVKTSPYLKNYCKDSMQFFYGNSRRRNIGLFCLRGIQGNIYFENRPQIRWGDTINMFIYVTNETEKSFSRDLKCILPKGIKYLGAATNSTALTGNKLNDTITWRVNNVDYGKTLMCGMRMYADKSILAVNDIVQFTASMTTDTSNYGDTLRSIVVAAYDPNLKDCQPFGIIPTATKKLRYTIHFQNLGSSYANKVIVTDTFSSLLLLERVLIYGASHYYTIKTDGRNLIFTFPNINLQPSEADAAASKGWIDLEIELKPGLADGTVIDNKAYIYFDYNLPVITNTARVILSKYAGTRKLPEKTQNNTLEAFPNPGNELLTLKNTSYLAQTLSIYDLSGRLVFRHELKAGSSIQLNTENYKQGIYFIRGNGETLKWLKTP